MWTHPRGRESEGKPIKSALQEDCDVSQEHTRRGTGRRPADGREVRLAVLELIDVTKVYKGGKRAVDGMTMRLGPGMLGLLGPNGAGSPR